MDTQENQNTPIPPVDQSWGEEMKEYPGKLRQEFKIISHALDAYRHQPRTENVWKKHYLAIHSSIEPENEIVTGIMYSLEVKKVNIPSLVTAGLFLDLFKLIGVLYVANFFAQKLGCDVNIDPLSNQQAPSVLETTISEQPQLSNTTYTNQAPHNSYSSSLRVPETQPQSIDILL